MESALCGVLLMYYMNIVFKDMWLGSRVKADAGDQWTLWRPNLIFGNFQQKRLCIVIKGGYRSIVVFTGRMAV